MKRLVLYLFIALFTFSVGCILWQAIESHSPDVRLLEAENQQQAKLHALQSELLYGEIKRRMQNFGCVAPERIKEERRQLLCDQLQSHLDDLSKELHLSY